MAQKWYLGSASALIVGVALLASACTNGGTAEPTPDVTTPEVTETAVAEPTAEPDPVAPAERCTPGSTLTLETFINWPGGIISAFEAEYDVTVFVEQLGESPQALRALMDGLAVGEGVGDVVIIDGDQWAAAVVNPDDFVTLPEIPGRWLAWAEDEGRVDGELKGYRTDISPVTVMYNATLLEESGFRQYAEPENFGEWIGGSDATWETYLAAGREFTAATGIPWVDSIADGPLRVGMLQMPAALENPATGLPKDLATNTPVHDLYLEMGAAVEDGLSAGVGFSDNDWGTTLVNDGFATIVAPTWMMGWPLFPVGLGLVDGDWRVSPVLPSGSVNWGGSFAVVPYISHNIDCAIALADWLTSDGTAQEMWPAQGSFPAQTAVLAEGVTTTEDQSTFFGGQDVAQVFTDMAKSIHSPTYRGRNYPWIQDDVILGSMAAVQQGSQTTEQAWDQAVSMFDAKDFTATD